MCNTFFIKKKLQDGWIVRTPLRGSRFRHVIQFLTYCTPWFSILGEEMTVRDKNHQYQHKMTFWNLICKYVFLKSDEKVTRNMIFLCLCVFFPRKYELPLLTKRFSQSARNHPDAFILDVSKRSIQKRISESALFGLIRNCDLFNDF